MKTEQAKAWSSQVSGGGHQGLVYDEATGKTVALTYDPADRHLVAAAPELLDALLQVCRASEDCGDMNDIDWDGIRAAIAKATGETP